MQPITTKSWADEATLAETPGKLEVDDDWVRGTLRLTASGVRYVPLVGKVTVAMLERNLLRLYEGYHAPRRAALAAARHREDVAKLEKLEHKLERFSRASLALAAIAAALGYVLGKRHLL